MQQLFSAAESSTPVTATNGDAKSSPTSVPVPSHAEPPSLSSNAAVVEPPLPSLTAAAISEKGPSPTNAAFERSLNATTSDAEKLKVALAEIERLQAQLAEAQGPQVTGLRKRGGASTSATVDTAVEKAKEVVAASQGVPVEVVGALLFAVFVLTYLFF